MSAKPQPPVACSLSAADAETRQAQWRGLLSRAAVSRTTIAGGMRVERRPESNIRAELARLVELERECCPFLELTIEETKEGALALSVTAPTDAEGIVKELLAQP
jgi:hypothetical protein